MVNQQEVDGEIPDFASLINLAEERLGAKVIEANDEFFAEKENLIKPGRGIFIPDKYTDRGKWMDGWETKRRRSPGHDWCIVKLAQLGRVGGVDIDTNHFLGNHPPEASLDGRCAKGDWEEILPRSPLEPGSQNFFATDSQEYYEEVRLNIYPDGGVARLRVFGEVFFEPKAHLGEQIDLASIFHGARVISCNDMFFSSKDNLIMPGRGVNMGDGWETKRRRSPGHDWVMLKLAGAGKVDMIEVDTHHFKGNYPDRCSIDGIHWTDSNEDPGADGWQEILPEQKLSAHKQHYFSKEISNQGPWTHVRLNIYPDGGVSRMRVLGQLDL